MIKKILLGIFILIGLISCTNDDDNNNFQEEAICDSSNTSFNQLYNDLSASTSIQDEITMDLETHSYDFEVLESKTICQIGYQSLQNFNSTPYLIEIFDNTSSTLLYSDSHIFSSSDTEYVSITPIQVEVGHLYTIKRIQTNWNGNISNTIGRLISGNLSFPNTYGELTITSSSFYGTGGPLDDWGIPYIDIVFQN
ncbi:hypothetical protein [Pontimicrobium sp. IMCC45349]|uniref:hypothetical protein n=1 Tax=Pontimicrobium sp. IMCC45349 TaxID=3391574 RepID=UPI00399F3FEF